MNFFNQDPNFFSSLGQNNNAQSAMGQLQQPPQLGNQAKLPHSQPQRPQFTNKPSHNDYQNLKPFTNGNPSLPGVLGSPGETGIPSSFGNNQGMVQYDGSSIQSNLKNPNSDKDLQQMVQYYQQIQQQQLQSPTHAKQYPTPLANPLMSTYNESPQPPSPLPNYPPSSSSLSNYPPSQQFPSAPIQTSPYNEYQFMQGSSYQDSHSQMPGGQPAYGNNKNVPYEDSGYPSTYQASQDQAKSHISEIQNADQAGYTMPPFSPIDPLASAIDGSHQDIQEYYGYQQASTQHKSPLYSTEQIAQNGGSTGMHEISPYSDEKNSPEYENPTKSSSSKSSSSSDSTAGYMTPEQLFAPHSTGLQSEAKYGFASNHGEHSESSKDSIEAEAAGSTLNEQHEGSERAALHLPEEVSIYVARQTDNPYLYEYTEAYDPFAYDVSNDKSKAESDSSKQMDAKDAFNEAESDEKFNERIREYQKLLTKAPKNNYMVEPTQSPSLTSSPLTTTTRMPVFKKASDAEADEMKNHKTTHSYMFQYMPSERSTNTKPNPVWNSKKPNATRYHFLVPETKLQTTTTPSTTTTMTTTTTTTQAPPSFPQTSATPSYYNSVSASQSYYHEPETPACARYNNLTYCLQDSEYQSKCLLISDVSWTIRRKLNIRCQLDEIKRAIEKNRHPLDHFLVDISASSNIVDDSLNKVFENSVPLQSTSVSYSFEGKAISPSKSDSQNATGCISNVQYAKPLRAINTAGLWKIIVNVEFEETGANYTQTVRIEECSHTAGFVATCGTETISACLQQYKLYRLLAWEPHRGFYIDAFLLPISCFCGSQQS
ncbi:uncharacterized protein CEXT_54081 [Caerostris extrusa]|uniref:Spaetzle domain-containing protein n=1 Tax=Caerostris extrusa TaxID=172846 RepID=A0AAV4NU05_CAEEX|nr:uncharacterized protein CEXT_54081 [Caerostris extrusa]